MASGWIGARLRESANSQLSDDERRLAYAKDALVGLVAVTGLATAAEGMRFARMAPEGAVRWATATTRPRRQRAGATQQAPRQRAQHPGNLICEVALVAVNSALSQEGFRRPPARRFIPRWGRL